MDIAALLGDGELGLALRTIEDAGGLPYAVAAVGEGFCPCCRQRLLPPGDITLLGEPLEVLDGYPSTPHAQGGCLPCALMWATGAHSERRKDILPGWPPDWLVIDDYAVQGRVHRVILNPRAE